MALCLCSARYKGRRQQRGRNTDDFENRRTVRMFLTGLLELSSELSPTGDADQVPPGRDEGYHRSWRSRVEPAHRVILCVSSLVASAVMSLCRIPHSHREKETRDLVACEAEGNRGGCAESVETCSSRE